MLCYQKAIVPIRSNLQDTFYLSQKKTVVSRLVPSRSLVVPHSKATATLRRNRTSRQRHYSSKARVDMPPRQSPARVGAAYLRGYSGM